jgi:hypothetical protein
MQTSFVITDQPPQQENSMKRMKYSKIGLVFGAAALGALTGCVGYVEEPHVYAPSPPPVYVEREVVVQPQYTYYPSHQVYYASHTRQYVYRDGRAWVSRPTPPRVSVDVLFASPSVRLGFSDAPSHHHSSVVRQYPRNWRPPGSNPNNQGNRGRGRGNDRDRR